MRGGLHVGALKALQEFQGDLEFPDGIYGTSVGAIMATAVAFHVDLDKLKSAYDKYFSMSTILPPPNVDHIFGVFENKGIFPMDVVANLILKVFDEAGVNLRDKRVCDAPQKLFILASNMSTGRPTFLTGKVPIMDALRCSSAIPVVFEPQMLYGQLYLDGGVQIRCIRNVIPKESLAIHISGTGGVVSQKSSLGEILFACYGGDVSQYIGKNMVRIRGVNYGILAELTQEDRDIMVKEGYSQTLAFLTKRLAEKGE